ncbi:hypothetical protein N431DRAFT_503544 [Stipitochalara longipes BDJ]|nr:hypothetical protein N431DRAFT_503544 [Stipitochalara longipes BDJ]
MTSIFMSFLLAALLLADTTFSLQVSSNSPCTSLCLDVGQNATTITTNTSGGDITCQDADYVKTESGQKFISCVSCLQTSTASDEDGSDQEWFLYNLRFALDSCLFGFQQPVDFVPNPCSTSQFCEPLELAIGDGNHTLSNESEYSYCSADSNAILGASLNQCRDCLSNTSGEKYLRNFLTALQAGCVQQPSTGTLIGLEGNVFSHTPVNITFPGYHQPAPVAVAHKSGLPQAAIIGIAVGLTILLLLAIAIVVICARRRRTLNRLRRLKLESSPLDSRFGAVNITAPTNGSYGNPYSQPRASVNEPFDPSKFQMPQLVAPAITRDVLEKRSSTREMTSPSGGWLDGAHVRLAGQRGAALPTHQAYNPNVTSPISPSSSDGTTDTYQMKDYPSSRSSPKNFPPPLIREPKPPMHKKSPSAQSQTQVPQMRAINPPQVYASSAPKIEFRPDSQATIRYEPRNRSLSRTRGESKTRNESRTREGSRTRAESRAQSRADSRNESREQSRTRNDSRTRILDGRTRGESRTRDDSRSRGVDESSRVSPPGLHSQRMGSIADEQYPSRSGSRSDNYKRATVRPGIDNTNASGDNPLNKTGRFDFELAEKERKEKELMEGLASITKDSFKKKKARPEDATPISADSDEQWPGIY